MRTFISSHHRETIARGFAAMLLLSWVGALPLCAASPSPDEARYYRIVTIPIPAEITLEAGALQFMPNGQLAASTRLGDIYLIDNVLEEPPSHVKFNLFASGLHEVLGLADRDGWLYCTQRGEVTRMKDLDGDGRADLFETVNDDWGIGGDYHEYAFGSKFDRDGNLWVALCLTGSFTSENPYRGWCLRITPDGKMIPTCSGLRSPGGIGMNSVGDMFFTDNQGPWNGADALKHLAPGDFEGNPSGNVWYKSTDALGPRPRDPRSGSRMAIEAKKIPQLKPPAVYFPYPKMGQSASGIACDGTGGKFGPFQNQLFVGDQAHSTVMRVFLEKVNDRYQGACFMVRNGFDSGNLALEFAPDGSLFVYGTDRGWGARGGKPFALQRMIWTREVPFEVKEMRAKPDGFELAFTQPVDRATAGDPRSYLMETYTYIYQSSYGSPEVDQTRPTIKSVTISEDGFSARLLVNGLQEGHVHELHLPGVRSTKGQLLLHDAAYYTLNYIPTK
jgi:glucose/arabinose dehydrogenase